MLYVRNLVNFLPPLFIIVACCMTLGVLAYPYSEDEADVYHHRSKRMNHISCHCCANSFNSYCCLQCIQRLSKRSGETSTYDAEPFQYSPEAYGPYAGEDQLDEPSMGAWTLSTHSSIGQLLALLRSQGRYKRSASETNPSEIEKTASSSDS